MSDVTTQDIMNKLIAGVEATEEDLVDWMKSQAKVKWGDRVGIEMSGIIRFRMLRVMNAYKTYPNDEAFFADLIEKASSPIFYPKQDPGLSTKQFQKFAMSVFLVFFVLYCLIRMVM